MTTFRDRIEILLDVQKSNAENALRSFRTSVRDADSTLGKFKAGASSVLTAVSQYAGQLALAGGAALVGFGVKSVQAFQETALGAGQLRDSLGVTADEASRLREVGDDLGISVSALEATIGRMNRTADTTPGAFDEIGAAIARNRDGSVNTLQTFKNVAEALRNIPDPARRAAAAQEILGRSWQDVSELVMSGADGITRALASVEQAKVIDDAEIDQARAFRDAMDELRGAVEEVSIAAGGTLVPVLTDLAETVSDLNNIAGDTGLTSVLRRLVDIGPLGQTRRLVDVYEGLANRVTGLFREEKHRADFASTYNQANQAISDSISSAADAYADAQAEAARFEQSERSVDAAIRDAIEAQERQNEALREQRDEFRETAEGVYELHDAELALERATAEALETMADPASTMREVRAGLEGVAAAADRVAAEQVAMKGITLDTVAGQREWNRQILAVAATLSGPMRAEVLAHAARVNGLPSEKATEIAALIDAGSTQAAEDVLNRVARDRTATVRTVVTGGGGVSNRFSASGNPSTPEGPMVVGEQGPEVVELPGGSKVLSAAKSRDAARSGGTVVVNVTQHFPAGVDPTAAARAIDDYRRRNGPGAI
jgi:hypothetical protein